MYEIQWRWVETPVTTGSQITKKCSRAPWLSRYSSRKLGEEVPSLKSSSANAIESLHVGDVAHSEGLLLAVDDLPAIQVGQTGQFSAKRKNVSTYSKFSCVSALLLNQRGSLKLRLSKSLQQKTLSFNGPI